MSSPTNSSVLTETLSKAVNSEEPTSPSGRGSMDGPGDAVWILTSAFIIFTMISGFGLVESGKFRRISVNIEWLKTSACKAIRYLHGRVNQNTRFSLCLVPFISQSFLTFSPSLTVCDDFYMMNSGSFFIYMFGYTSFTYHFHAHNMLKSFSDYIYQYSFCIIQ